MVYSQTLAAHRRRQLRIWRKWILPAEMESGDILGPSLEVHDARVHCVDKLRMKGVN